MAFWLAEIVLFRTVSIYHPKFYKGGRLISLPFSLRPLRDRAVGGARGGWGLLYYLGKVITDKKSLFYVHVKSWAVGKMGFQ